MKIVSDGRMTSVNEGAIDGAAERIARLEDRIRIEELLAHYARCVDTQDAAGVAAAFLPDGCICGPNLQPVVGSERIHKLYRRLLSAMKSSLHLVGSQQVLFESPNCAVVHAAFYAWDSYLDEADPDCYSFGFYEAKALKEEDGEWRFSALNIHFAGQLDSSSVPYPGGRACEQFGRPWPPTVLE